jgi:heme iron utilization protein
MASGWGDRDRHADEPLWGLERFFLGLFAAEIGGHELDRLVGARVDSTTMSRGHATPRRAEEEPLYDPSVPTPSHAERARTLVEQHATGALATLALDPEGHPYGSFVTFALAGAAPVFLFSELAEHTRNLRGDGRASLMVAESVREDPLANGRVTLVGVCRAVAEGGRDAQDAYLERFPGAAYYAGYRDFGFWRLEVESARYIGGYGRMSWVPGEEWAAARSDPLAPHAAAIVGHMNADHPEALALLCRAFSRATEAESAVMTGIDRYGFELSVATAAGRRPVRLAFEAPVTTPGEARQALVAMVSAAREG